MFININIPAQNWKFWRKKVNFCKKVAFFVSVVGRWNGTGSAFIRRKCLHYLLLFGQTAAHAFLGDSSPIKTAAAPALALAVRLASAQSSKVRLPHRRPSLLTKLPSAVDFVTAQGACTVAPFVRSNGFVSRPLKGGSNPQPSWLRHGFAIPCHKRCARLRARAFVPRLFRALFMPTPVLPLRGPYPSARPVVAAGPPLMRLGGVPPGFFARPLPAPFVLGGLSLPPSPSVLALGSVRASVGRPLSPSGCALGRLVVRRAPPSRLFQPRGSCPGGLRALRALFCALRPRGFSVLAGSARCAARRLGGASLFVGFAPTPPRSPPLRGRGGRVACGLRCGETGAFVASAFRLLPSQQKGRCVPFAAAPLRLCREYKGKGAFLEIVLDNRTIVCYHIHGWPVSAVSADCHTREAAATGGR